MAKPLPNAQGEQYFSIGGDHDTGTAQSPTFELPSDAQSLEFLRCGGADSPSGVSVHRESGSVVCSSSRGEDTDSFFWDSCDVSSAAGERVYVRIVDTQSSYWGKVFVDNIRLDGGGGGCGSADITSCPITRDFCTNDASLPDNCNCGDCGYPACGDCDCDYYGDGQCCTGSCTSWLSAHERCHDAHATGDDVSCCVGGDIRATCQCAAHYEWWDDRRLSAVDEPRRLGHCCDYGAYCSCMESELGAGCTAPDCGGDDWDCLLYTSPSPRDRG